MDEHTRRIFRRMIALLNDYQEGTIGLRYLVDGLEGSLNVLEEKLPDSFYAQWYVYWGGLEQILAASTMAKRQKEILEEVDALKTLLAHYI